MGTTRNSALVRRAMGAVALLALVGAACTRPKAAAGRPDPAVVRDAHFTCPQEATSIGAAAPAPLSGRKLAVATTVAPLTSIVANVAGDRATVTGVIPEGQDS